MKSFPLWRQALTGALFFIAGVISSQTWLASGNAAAQQSKPAPAGPQAFLAADERTEPVIREILTTIKKMDGRLENIEKSVVGAKKPAEASSTSSRTRPR